MRIFKPCCSLRAHRVHCALDIFLHSNRPPRLNTNNANITSPPVDAFAAEQIHISQKDVGKTAASSNKATVCVDSLNRLLVAALHKSLPVVTLVCLNVAFGCGSNPAARRTDGQTDAVSLCVCDSDLTCKPISVKSCRFLCKNKSLFSSLIVLLLLLFQQGSRDKWL